MGVVHKDHGYRRRRQLRGAYLDHLLRHYSLSSFHVLEWEEMWKDVRLEVGICIGRRGKEAFWVYVLGVLGYLLIWLLSSILSLVQRKRGLRFFSVVFGCCEIVHVYISYWLLFWAGYLIYKRIKISYNIFIIFISCLSCNRERKASCSSFYLIKLGQLGSRWGKLAIKWR